MKKTDEQLTWTEIECEHIEQNNYLDFCRLKYRFPDGSEFSPFYRYSRRDYVVIVAEDEEGKMICVRQFRHGIRKVTVEFPAGGIDRDGADYAGGSDAFASAAVESTLEAAKRELQEESGYASDDWHHLISIPSNATMADNYAHVYFAGRCRKISDLDLDDTEFLEPLLCTKEEIEALIKDGTFAQAMHVMGWLLAKPYMQHA